MLNHTKHILIAYFSHSGNTRKIANLIHNKVDGVLHEIQPEKPYPDAYNAVVEYAKEEIRAGYQPSLQKSFELSESIDTIIVGSPNWWGTIAHPVASFLSEYDLSGKRIAPFCTHGGGGMGRIESDIAKLCPESTILSCLKIYGNGTANTQAEVSIWLKRIGILQ